MTRQYDANGHLSGLTYPASYLGSIVDYAPNAPGQPTKAGIYASAVTYFPNGVIRFIRFIASVPFGPLKQVVNDVFQNNVQKPAEYLAHKTSDKLKNVDLRLEASGARGGLVLRLL